MLVNELKAEIVRKGLTMEEFAREVGIARTTFWRRMSNPDEFTLIEIKEICKILELDNSRIQEIFFAKQVS